MSIFLVGNKKNYQCEAWKDGMNLPPGSPKEKQKFKEIVRTLRPTSIQEILHGLDPKLENSIEKKAYFQDIFRMDSFNKDDFDRCMV